MKRLWNAITGKYGRRSNLTILAVIALAIPLLLGAASMGGFLSPIGSVHASTPSRQNGSDDPAGGAAQKAPAEGTEAFDKLVENVPIDRAYLRSIRAREKAVQLRERELDRRERELLTLKLDIERKLATVEEARTELKRLIAEHAKNKAEAEKKQTEEKARAEKLLADKREAAGKKFKSLGPEAAAATLLQMDLESGTIILDVLTPAKIGEIFDAMQDVIGAGADAAAKRQKMGELWDRLAMPDKPETNPAEAAPVE